MKHKIVFGKWEVACLLINGVLARVFLNVPRPFAESSGTAGWVEAIYVTALGFLFFFIISKLYSKFEGKDILDVSELLGGNFFKIVVGFLIIGGLGFGASIILREYGENMKVIFLESSPLIFVVSFFIACAVVGAFMGIESIVRIHAIALPVIITGLLIILIAVYPYYNITNLLPILGNGAVEIFGKGIIKVVSIAPLLYLFMIFPFIKTYDNFKKAGHISLGIAGLLTIFTSISYFMVFAYPVSTESFLPVYQLARLINFGRFFQRAESIFMIIWATCSFLYLSMLLFFITHTFQKIFKLKYRKPLVIPFAIIIFSVSFIPPNLTTAITLEVKYFTTIAFCLIFVAIPIILLLARILKKTSKA